MMRSSAPALFPVFRSTAVRWRLCQSLRHLRGVVATGRKARGLRAVDLLIAATALAANLPLCTRNVDDFRGIEHLLAIVGV